MERTIEEKCRYLIAQGEYDECKAEIEMAMKRSPDSTQSSWNSVREAI